jgi:hypothetical protein
MMSQDDEEKEDQQFRFKLSGGHAARDEALERVARGSIDYIAGGLVLIAQMPNGTEVIGEDIRLLCLNAGLVSHHHNAHGSLIKIAIDRGLLRRAGYDRHMRIKHNHARRSPVYRVRTLTPEHAAE